MRRDDPETRINIALAEHGLKQYAEALRDFDLAIASGINQPRLYLMRSEVRTRLGDAEGARRDHEEGVRREPVDARGWIARSVARTTDRDYTGALADLDRALAIDPTSWNALINKASLLSEHLNRSDDAVAQLDLAVKTYPEDASLRASRGVLLARLGRRNAALNDADHALELTPSPKIQWQVASAYALTSKTNPEDQLLALQYLAAALRRKPQIVEDVVKDADLNALVGNPSYDRLIDGARSARHASASPIAH